MKTEGVKLPDPEVGWFFKEKLGLDALRRQLLDTALQGAEAYGTIEGEWSSAFQRFASTGPSLSSLGQGQRAHDHQAHLWRRPAVRCVLGSLFFAFPTALDFDNLELYGAGS